jgi:hypothetical protein
MSRNSNRIRIHVAKMPSEVPRQGPPCPREDPGQHLRMVSPACRKCRVQCPASPCIPRFSTLWAAKCMELSACMQLLKAVQMACLGCFQVIPAALDRGRLDFICRNQRPVCIHPPTPLPPTHIAASHKVAFYREVLRGQSPRVLFPPFSFDSFWGLHETVDEPGNDWKFY